MIPLTSHSPKICLALRSRLDGEKELPGRLCKLPVTDEEFRRPSWKKSSSAASKRILPEWAFWQIWQFRVSKTSSMRLFSDPQFAILAKEWLKTWEKGHKSPAFALRHPPLDVSAAVRDGWKVYGKAVMDMYRLSGLSVSEANFDLNGDGRRETVFRISVLDFGRDGSRPIDYPRTFICHDDEERQHSATALFVEMHENASIGSALQNWGWAAYDTFTFQGHRYLVARPFDRPDQLGWIVSTEPGIGMSSRYTPINGVQGISLKSLCQFNQSIFHGQD